MKSTLDGAVQRFAQNNEQQEIQGGAQLSVEVYELILNSKQNYQSNSVNEFNNRWSGATFCTVHCTAENTGRCTAERRSV